jgi:hypothetical protein
MYCLAADSALALPRRPGKPSESGAVQHEASTKPNLEFARETVSFLPSLHTFITKKGPHNQPLDP